MENEASPTNQQQSSDFAGPLLAQTSSDPRYVSKAVLGSAFRRGGAGSGFAQGGSLYTASLHTTVQSDWDKLTIYFECAN